ncbi:MAG: hypothetical protein V2A66_07690 [Pseudomonadota bacterium]
MNTLRFDLKLALDHYESKTGIRLSYAELSKTSGISMDTLKSLASRSDYNATFETISQVGMALNLNPIDFFEWKINPDASK